MGVLEWFIPRETKFFVMLKDQSENLLLGAKAFEKLVKNYDKLSDVKRDACVKSIADIEYAGDVKIHAIVDALNKTFITPIDREDIHRLTSLMDDVLDSIYAVSIRVQAFKVKDMDKFVQGMTDIITEISKEMNALVAHLDSSGHTGDMKDYFIKINALENEADIIYRNGLAGLFEKKRDPVEIIKLKEIYDLLETVTDSVEDVANVIEGIVVKHG